VRRILQQSSLIGSTNPEPKPLAYDLAALIAVPTASDAVSSRPADMDGPDAYPFLGNASAAPSNVARRF